MALNAHVLFAVKLHLKCKLLVLGVGTPIAVAVFHKVNIWPHLFNKNSALGIIGTALAGAYL